MSACLSDTRDHAAFLLELGRTAADVIAYQARQGPAFLVIDPAHAARVLLDDGSCYYDAPHPFRQLAGHLMPYGALVLGIEARGRHAEIRDQVGRALGSLAAAAAESLARDSGGEPVAVLGPLHALLLRFKTAVLFGVSMTDHADGFVAATRLLEECWASELVPDPSMQPLWQDYVRAVSVQNEFVDHIGSAAAIAAPRGVILRTLLNGYHATATALTWALWELGRHHGLQEAVRAEVDAVCGGRRPASSDTRRLHLTHRVVLETLRCHPPAWNIGRTAVRDHDLGGVRIPEGSHVSVSPYVMQRCPARWPRADEFDPGRFASGAGARRVRCGYLPFGAGPRRCPAARDAVEQLQILLAAVVQRSRLDAVDAPVRARGLIGLRPDPDVYLRVVRRGTACV